MKPTIIEDIIFEFEPSEEDGSVLIAHERHCGRMEWTCLDWNQPSIDFYLSLGAVPMNEWTLYRLDAKALENLK